jgi:hypothetical protein
MPTALVKNKVGFVGHTVVGNYRLDTKPLPTGLRPIPTGRVALAP